MPDRLALLFVAVFSMGFSPFNLAAVVDGYSITPRIDALRG
jgi:hypothetical protein